MRREGTTFGSDGIHYEICAWWVSSHVQFCDQEGHHRILEKPAIYVYRVRIYDATDDPTRGDDGEYPRLRPLLRVICAWCGRRVEHLRVVGEFDSFNL